MGWFFFFFFFFFGMFEIISYIRKVGWKIKGKVNCYVVL
jgi:hypothetical protein